jgi:FkbM family methyltransferase
MLSHTVVRFLRRVTHVFFRYRGLARLAQRIRRHYARGSRIELVEDFDGTRRFYCHLDEHMGSSIFWRGSYSGGQLEFLRRVLEPDMVFVDAGANQGEFTVFAAGRLDEGEVISFEPVTTLFDRLRRNVQANGFTNVTLEPSGLGSEQAECPIYRQAALFPDGTQHEGLSSLYPTADRCELVEHVRVVPLDDYVSRRTLDRLDVLKIDVEGAELAVLLGGVESIKRFAPLIILELNEETSRAAGYGMMDVLEFLDRSQYRVELIHEDGRSTPLKNTGVTDFQNVACFPA